MQYLLIIQWFITGMHQLCIPIINDYPATSLLKSIRLKSKNAVIIIVIIVVPSTGSHETWWGWDGNQLPNFNTVSQKCRNQKQGQQKLQNHNMTLLMSQLDLAHGSQSKSFSLSAPLDLHLTAWVSFSPVSVCLCLFSCQNQKPVWSWAHRYHPPVFLISLWEFSDNLRITTSWEYITSITFFLMQDCR